MDAIGVENSRTTDETATPDVIVVGGGGSGLAAAITAAGEGAQVLLLEKNPALGGSTAWSVGSYSASRTLDQRRAGIGDSAEAHFEDMGKFIGEWSARDNLAMRRLLAEEAGPTLEWLRAHVAGVTGDALAARQAVPGAGVDRAAPREDGVAIVIALHVGQADSVAHRDSPGRG